MKKGIAQMLTYTKKTYWFFRERTRNFLRDTVVDTVRECDVRGRRFRIGMSNPLEGYRIATYETKEPETLEWLESTLKPDDVLYDIGANIGLFSVYAAAVQPAAKVYAFEPSVLNFTRLFRNMLHNDLKNLMPMNVAVSGETRFDYFHMSEWSDGAAMHGFGIPCDICPEKINPKLKHGTYGVTLDDLVFKNALPQPTHIKLDVDSIEEQILQGASKVLSSPACRHVLVEITLKEGEPNPIQSLLESHGFHMARTSEWKLNLGGHIIQNYIFEKRS